MPALAILPVPLADARKALRLSLAVTGQSAADLERQVTAFLEYARVLRFDLGRQWLLTLDGRPLAAVTCLEPPGRTAMLLLRDGRLPPPPDDALLRHAVQQEAQRDIRLLQCLIDPDDSVNFAALTRAGFTELATLVYMERGISPDSPPPPAAWSLGALQWRPYDDELYPLFAGILSDTYRDSLDCPRLTGLRTIDDIIAGHRAAGLFDPRRWWLVMRDDRPAGCILLTENPLRPALELAYMGVHPDHRRRGLAGLLLTHALGLAQRGGFEVITLAVDAANHPARRLYASFGFRETASRRAFVLPTPSSSSTP